MSLDERILAWLEAHRGEPQSIEQLSAAIPEASPASILSACTELREQRRVGRNGAGLPGRPFCFYLKRTEG